MRAPTARSWGWTTHRYIEQKAELAFSNEPSLSKVHDFLSEYHDYLYNWCTYPDSNKSFMPDGSGADDWHWVDVDSYDPLNIPDGYDGELHLAMQWMLDNIVYYLQNGDNVWAAQLMGAICHFTGDATCPLHATWNYWLGGKHTTFEGRINNFIEEISVPTNYVPKYIENVTDAALAVLAESFSFTAEGSGEDTNLTYYLNNNILWNDWIKNMVENRVTTAIQFTADVWYTAMVQAGFVSSVISSVNPITPHVDSAPFTITATARENSQSVSLYYRHSTDNSSWGEWTFFENDYSSPYSWSFTAPQGDGYYEFYSIASWDDNVELSSNTADARCVVGMAAPVSCANNIALVIGVIVVILIVAIIAVFIIKRR